MNDWYEWESGDHLCSVRRPDSELTPAEILQRVAVGFRRVVIDWVEGDRYLDWRIAKQMELGCPPVIVNAERERRGRTALVTVSEGTDPTAVRVQFFFQNGFNETFDLHYDPPADLENGRPIARRLAELIGYRFLSDDHSSDEGEDGDDDGEVDPVCDFLIHRNGMPTPGGKLPPPVAVLTVDELLRRIVEQFPLALIDRERGDELVRTGAAQLTAQFGDTAAPSVKRQLAKIGQVAYVTVRESTAGPSFRFFVDPSVIGNGMMIEYDTPQDQVSCRPLLRNFIRVLEDYVCMSQDLDGDGDDTAATEEIED